MYRLVRLGVLGIGLLPVAIIRTAPSDDPATTPPAATTAELLRRTITESLWPTDAGRIVTSTFGEFRSTHFHAGIDISTDVTGYRVYASRDGFVSRISISPQGYGKMLMVSHRDGYSTLYAHLSRFAGEIERIARRAQDSLGRYPVRIDCPPELLPVQRGDVIAYTGDTGVGTPHLHFEIHNEAGDPINPLHCEDFETADHLPPIIQRVAVIPTGFGSTVNGSAAPLILDAAIRRSTAGQLVRVEGAATLAVEARDPCNGTRFRRSAYRHTLIIDDHIYFATKLDRVDGEHLQLVGYHYEWPLWHNRHGRFERLFVPESLFLPTVFDAGPANGVLDATHLSPGTHRYRIVTEDFDGNRAEFNGFLDINPPKGTAPPPPVLAPYTILPGRSGRFVFDAGNLVIEYDSLSVFTPLPLEVELDTTGGYRSYLLAPETAFLRDGIHITLRSPGTDSSTGLFIRRRGGWSLIGRAGADGLLHGTIHRQLGEIAAMEDVTPPALSRLSVTVPQRGRPLITFRYSDNLAGIDYDELKMYLDGQAVIPEVDGEHRRVRYQSEQGLAFGSHHVSIRLNDRLGNLRTYDHRFVLR